MKSIAFASTSAIYGERDDLLYENSGPLLPISNYGATKRASEALLSAAAEPFVERLWLFGFPCCWSTGDAWRDPRLCHALGLAPC